MTERDRLPVIVTAQDEVCAVPGLRYGVAFSRNKTDRSKYIVSIRKDIIDLYERGGISMLAKDIEEVLITEEEIQEKIR